MLIDRYGRPLTHIRISVTLRCNHNCIFCHREGISSANSEELTAEEWGFVAKVAIKLGIKNFKLTGGEPLVRNDIVDIVRNLVEVGGEVTMVTNASLLEKYAASLAEAGIKRINVSLHSLKPEVFKIITGGGKLEQVIKGINAAVDSGIPLKINYLVMSVNSDEYKDIISFAESINADMNIIELIPLGLNTSEYRDLHIDLNEIEEYLEKYSVNKYVKEFQSRTTYVLPTGIKITLVKGFLNPLMCMKCTRVRATPDGKLKTCLYREDNMVDMKPAIKARDEEKLEEMFKKINMLREPFFKPTNRVINK